MAYVGNPIDTQNTFQSLVGKRFNGDGSTTDFTLDVAPSSTLDIEVFVGNVRQDPNSAYTLSGTTLSFTGAPPSGTNNIYVVHQAKAVSTIGIPDDTISARTLVTLDSSNDHVLIEDATDGELKKALVPTFDTDAAVVFNESGAAVDFRVESDGNANAFIVDGSADRVGFGIAAPETEMHIQSTSGECELRLTAASTSDARLRFGDTTTTAGGYIGYNRSTQNMYIRSANAGAAHVNIDGNGKTNITGGAAGDNIMDINHSLNGAAYGPLIRTSGVANDNNTTYFFTCADSSTVRMRIWSDGDLVNHDNSYGAISDERIKQDIVDATSQWEDIKALKIRHYKKKDDVIAYGDEAQKELGVIAQELEANGMSSLVKPEVLYKDYDADVKNGIANEGDIKDYKSVKYSVLYMKAVKALQEAITKIEALEARVTTLEG